MVEEKKDVPRRIHRLMLRAQRAELTEHHIYRSMAEVVPKDHNAEVLSCIADDELRHYEFWKERTGRDVPPDRAKIWIYWLLTRSLGLSFGVNLMERGENLAARTYEELSEYVPGVMELAEEENEHERTCTALIDEERLKYAGSIVLGLNDALVELTGAIAGLTFALRDGRLVAVAALITGIAASLSMGASEYLSTRTEEESSEEKHPVKAAIYTGVAYLVAVIFLVLPYLLLENAYTALGWTLANAVAIILAFTFYISVAKNYSFRKRFGEMIAISMGIAIVSFGIGLLVRRVLGVDV
ncbi:MAG: rubrerythrin family protein [Candidatus Eisenbacteria bacterium]|nr:rubrerythrin family protein [Candidatus Eisenbacteria bacterium]